MNNFPKSVVVIPTLRRPEMLALTLEKLSKTPQAEHLDVRIFLDTAPPETLEDVAYCRDTYLPTAEIFQAGEHVKVLSGCWNILNALKNGYETGADRIFLVEEDVFVAPNFFEWHWQKHSEGNHFVTCGRRHGRMPMDFYSNPGTCYTRESLGQVMPHICDDFFRDTKAYLSKHFPTMIGKDGDLDDGLIRKVQRSVNGKVTCAQPPVAFHQGFHYYNCFQEFKINGGSIQLRIAQLRHLLPTIDPHGRYTSDYEPYPQNTRADL